MSLAMSPTDRSPTDRAPSRVTKAEGGAHFIAGPRHAELCAELRRRRYMVVPVASAEPGKLRSAVDDAVEGALAMRGALPAGTPPDAKLEHTLRDQIFRARALGAAGLALTFPELRASDADLLDVDDGITLSTWLFAARRAPLLVVLDERDRDLGVWSPVALGDLAPRSPIGEIATPESEPASGKVEIAIPIEARPPPPPPVIAVPRRGVMKKRSLRLDSALVDPEPEAPPVAASKPAPVPLSPPASASESESESESEPEPEPVHIASPPPPEEPPAMDPPPARVTRSDRVVDQAEWRHHAVELDRARGPKPVAIIEKLFATRYMPLLGPLAQGEADGAVQGVVDAWCQSFEHSFREAFAALRVTGKRPPMVFDAPEIAARIARLNGARGVKLVLVDAMRFDVGERVGAELAESLAGTAVCVDRMVLWSALPTTTPTQLHLLGRGPEGLRDLPPEGEPEPEIVRGRAVGTLRRDRVGSREVMKLDLVEARLRGAGPAHDDRIESLAGEVAPIVAKFVQSMPPRTLVFLFGDHGFRLPSSPDGRSTGPATQGGVTPEEVLVPAQAWLVGGVH